MNGFGRKKGGTDWRVKVFASIFRVETRVTRALDRGLKQINLDKLAPEARVVFVGRLEEGPWQSG